MSSLDLDVGRWLRKYQLPSRPDTLPLDDPLDLIELARWYASARDMRSALGCIYLYVSSRQPDAMPTVEVALGIEVLEDWLASRARSQAS